MASARRSVVERWWTTAIEMAKSKAFKGCGRERMSATATECGWCWEAIVTRLVDLSWRNRIRTCDHRTFKPFRLEETRSAGFVGALGIAISVPV